MRLKFVSALVWVLLGACESSPEQATSSLLDAVRIKQPAGTGRYCDRFLEGSSRRVHHWECFRDIGRDSVLDPGPWMEERISVSRKGVVQEARRTWVVPDTLSWRRLADSITAALQKAEAQPVRCEWGPDPVGSIGTWFVDSALVRFQAVPITYPPKPERTPIPTRFRLDLWARTRPLQSCTPLMPLPTKRMEADGA